MTIQERELKLEQYRQEWKDNPAKRNIIERQARALKIANKISKQEKLI